MHADTKTPLPDVRLTVKDSDRRVDVTVDGKPFTSYIWPTTLKKPTLYPVRTADGVVVTRGFPPGPGERADHPHHVGLWLNYGDVNGFDFWNNSDAIKPEQAPKMGSIVHKEITRKESGKGRAELGVKTDWVTGARPDDPRGEHDVHLRGAPRRPLDRSRHAAPAHRPAR